MHEGVRCHKLRHIEVGVVVGILTDHGVDCSSGRFVIVKIKLKFEIVWRHIYDECTVVDVLLLVVLNNHRAGVIAITH